MEINRLSSANKALHEFEKMLENTDVPDNLFNKFISTLRSSINSFELISTRYKNIRAKIQDIHRQDHEWMRLNPGWRERKTHPDERYADAAIRVDVESLFIFGIILVRRTLPLIKMYLPDQPSPKVFEDLNSFYKWITETSDISPLAKAFLFKMKHHLVWLNAVLRFYRNKFIEHLDNPQQQGMNFDLGGKEFALHSYGWSLGATEETRVNEFRERMVKENVHLPQGWNFRGYVQILFKNIHMVPDTLIQEAFDLIEDIGIDSPDPRDIINHIEEFLKDLFEFMVQNFDKSNLSQFKR